VAYACFLSSLKSDTSPATGYSSCLIDPFPDLPIATVLKIKTLPRDYRHTTHAYLHYYLYWVTLHTAIIDLSLISTFTYTPFYNFFSSSWLYGVSGRYQTPTSTPRYCHPSSAFSPLHCGLHALRPARHLFDADRFIIKL
jgi:hypothetical protein